MDDVLSERARDIMVACYIAGIPGNRVTAQALAELSNAVHDALDANVADDN